MQFFCHMKKLFVFDIDKTIKPWFSDIPPSTKKAISLLKEKYTVCLATGRCFNEAIAVLEQLQLDYLICNGGSDVYYKHEMIYQNAPDFTQEVLRLKEIKPYHFFVCDNGVYSYNYPKWFKCIGMFKYFYPKTSTIYGLINLMSQIQNGKELNEMGTPHKFYVFGKYEGLLDYSHVGNWLHTFEFENKAIGIQFLNEYLDGFDEIICFGDSRNDISMFQIATRSYANKKGNSQLISIATDTFDIKEGIYKIVLKELDV